MSTTDGPPGGAPAAETGVLPLHLALAGRRVVIVGGGPVAARKVAACLAADADVLVVAPFACEAIAADARAGVLEWVERDYRPGDLDGAWLAVAATGDRDTDIAVERDATGQRTFCIRADDATAGTARSPAVLRRDDVVVSVGSTGAADPRRSAALRDAIAQTLDAGGFPLRRHRPGPGRVVLVGGGPGDADLLTLRARRELAAADVVVVDRLAPQSVLDELGPGVLILDVGKAPGRHPVPQHEINRLLVEHAQAGRRVVRLKGGDPYLLGRGAEEVAACRAAGVLVSVVPGVTSAFAVPAAAGIPVTHRGLARQVTVLSGHDSMGGVVDWPALVAARGTLVILMGVAALPRITAELMDAGADPSMPAAVIENGWTPAQRVITGTVATIADASHAAEVAPPAVIVLGDVAALAEG
jgi:uroporphyrin-III C-methyltransferase / precorrin-2 dehydrogenase / sirohydrochlorin ferrochelatase